MNCSIKKQVGKATVILSLLLSSVNSYALDAPKYSEMSDPLAIVLVVIAVVLLLAIAMLSFVVLGSANLYIQKIKDKAAKLNETAVKATIVAALCCTSSFVFAQESGQIEKAGVPLSTSAGGLSNFSFYMLLSVIGLELLVILVMIYFIKVFIAAEKLAKVPVTGKLRMANLSLLWQKINSFKPRHQEQEIMLDHNYDGIKELDNSLPRWWLWGFYLSIVFAFVYLYRFHVSHTAPSSIDEYNIAMANASEEREAYLKKAASNVDENTVTLLTDAASVDEGRKIFQNICSACHGPEGQGGVGPNLTDNYWLHKGGIQDVFRTIKYGYPEKGMKSWKDDFSPTQIAKIASYVKTLTGTNPVNPKEPQGDLYKDSDTPKKDSLNLPQKKINDLNTGITKK